MTPKIVILGGSFNPPTIAHFNLMKAALDRLEAQMGIYVPVSRAYLKRKMAKQQSSFCLSEEMRLQMLESMCASDGRMTVSTVEYGDPRARTYDTMAALQQEYPDAQLYFLMGVDKLNLIHLFAGNGDFLERFYLAVFSREKFSADKIIPHDPLLAPHLDHFVYLPRQDEGLHISSTAVRNAMLAGEDPSTMLHPGVNELLHQVRAEDFPEEIICFREQYDFLGNRYPARFEWNGQCHGCLEEAYQASETEDGLALMKELLRQKFAPGDELAERLLATGEKLLINGNRKNERYWGTDLYTWEGENHLGQLLMEVRNELSHTMGQRPV